MIFFKKNISTKAKRKIGNNVIIKGILIPVPKPIVSPASKIYFLNLFLCHISLEVILEEIILGADPKEAKEGAEKEATKKGAKAE